MGEIVNLNKFRKAKAKAERVKEADVNRRQHGLSKAERTQDELHKQQFTRHLDGARLEPTQPGEGATDEDAPPSPKS
jgi:hypothetical protein